MALVGGESLTRHVECSLGVAPGEGLGQLKLSEVEGMQVAGLGCLPDGMVQQLFAALNAVGIVVSKGKIVRCARIEGSDISIAAGLLGASVAGE